MLSFSVLSKHFSVFRFNTVGVGSPGWAWLGSYVYPVLGLGRLKLQYVEDFSDEEI